MSTKFHIFFFFNDTATTEIYTLSLHDALPISAASRERHDLADAEHAHAAVRIEQRVRLVARGADRPPGVLRELARLRRGDDQHAVAAGGELAREPADVSVHLVRRLPGARRDLGEG